MIKIAILDINIFTPSESEKLKHLLKNPEEDLHKILSILEDKIVENNRYSREIEKKYRSLLDGLTHAEIGIDIVNKDHKILFQNEVLKERFGKSKENICYESYLDLEKPCETCPMEEALKYNRVERTKLDTADGKTYELISAPYPNQDGSIDKVAEVIIDITERTKIEQKLRESEEKFRTIAEQSLVGIIIIQNEKVVYVNNAEAFIMGYSVEEMMEWCLEDLFNHIYPDDREGALKRNRRSLGVDEILPTFSYRILTKLNEIKFVEIYSKIIDFNEQPAILTYVLDITDKKRAEKKLKESEEKFRNIAEQSLIGIGIVQDNLMKYVNRKFADIFGYTVDEMLRWSSEEFMKTVHPEDRAFVFDQVKKKQSDSEDYLQNYQFRGLKKSGEEIWIENFTKSIIYEGKASDFVAFIDITERKNAQQEIIKLNQLKSELLRRTSHELKTPLVSIKGFCELLLEIHRDKLDAMVISTLNEIKQGCLRLETLIGDILKTAELDSGKIELHKSEENLAFLIRICVNEIKGFSKLRNHRINVELQENLITQFEKEQIHQVISNLLNNAVKYTPPGGLIEIKSEFRDDFIIISIKDDGIGFTEEEKTRIFNQFGKIERYGQGLDIIAEGSGFGLFISKKIIELHDGEIWVESEGRNKGSTFYFSLPLIYNGKQ
ncbi:MAG: PAS domain S-box protein [Promethearchaeota archaeon]